MVAAQAGDGVAYATLLHECVSPIRFVGAGIGVPASQLDDLVQDVLLAIHRARHTYDPAQPFSPWLRTIAQRRAIDLLRRNARQAAARDQCAGRLRPISGSGAVGRATRRSGR